MLCNLYLVPQLLGRPIEELDIWHGSSDQEPAFVEHVRPAYLALWTDDEKAWAADLYGNPEFQSVRERYIEIARLLNTTPPGPKRTRLVEEMYELRG